MDADKFVENVIAVFVGTKHERDIKKLESTIAAINALEPEMQQLDDDDFRLRTAELKQRVSGPGRVTSPPNTRGAVCRYRRCRSP